MPIQQMMFPNYAVALNAAPVYRASGTADSGNGAITPGLPAGTTVGDVLICAVQSSNEAISAPTNVGGTNWTGLSWAEVLNSPLSTGTPAAAGAVRLGVFWIRIPAGTTPGTISIADTGNHTVGQVAGFSGCIGTGNPWDVTNGVVIGAVSALTWNTAPNITTTVGNTLAMIILGNSLDSTTSPVNQTTTCDWTACNVATPGRESGTFLSKNASTGTGGGIDGLMLSPSSDCVVANAGTLSTGGNGIDSGIVDPAFRITSIGACNIVALTIALRSN